MHSSPSDPDLVERLGRALQALPPSALAILERRRRLLALAALAGGIAGAVAARVLPPWYESSARLVVVPVDDPTTPGGSNAIDAANATLPMLVAILRSRSVADQTAEKLGLAAAWGVKPELARLRLAGEVTVASDRKSNVVTITVEDHQPQRASAIARTVAELASALAGEIWAARNHEHRRRVEADLADVSVRLAAAEDAMREFRERTHVVDWAVQVKATVEQAAALERLRIDKAMNLRFARGYGDGESVEVRRASRDRETASRELAVLRRGPGDAGPLLPLADLPRLEVEHARLKRAIDEQSARRELLSLKVSQLRAAEARPGGRAELVDAPVEPDRRAGPSTLGLAAAGAVLAALSAALVVIFAARRRAALAAASAVEAS